MGESPSESRALLNTQTWVLLHTRRGKITFVSFAAGVVLVLLTAAAAACIPWKGEMEVAPQGGGETTTVHGGHGTHDTGMVWCVEEYTADNADAQPYESAKASATEDVKISVDVSGCDTQLPDGDYTVTYADDAFRDADADDLWEDDDWVRDCMDTGLEDYDYRWSDRLNVASDGTGSVTIDLSKANPSDSSGDTEAAALCITEVDPGGDTERGNMAPISIIS